MIAILAQQAPPQSGGPVRIELLTTRVGGRGRPKQVRS